MIEGTAHRLAPHPATPCLAVRSIQAQARRTATTLELRYALAGDIGRLAIPAQNASRRADRLWQHTCFEAFVAAQGATGYLELNFSPSTEWAIYRFNGYRDGMTAVDPERPPRITLTRRGDRLTLKAAIDMAPLAELGASPSLRLALAAVVEEAGGHLSYWALEHPPGKPDFHHADSFALELPSPAA